MDTYEVPDITFLDLADEDEETRKEIIQKLSDKNTCVQLPWKVLLPRKADYYHNSHAAPPPPPPSHLEFSSYVGQPPEPPFGHLAPSMYPPAINYPIPPQYYFMPCAPPSSLYGALVDPNYNGVQYLNSPPLPDFGYLQPSVVSMPLQQAYVPEPFVEVQPQADTNANCVAVVVEEKEEERNGGECVRVEPVEREGGFVGVKKSWASLLKKEPVNGVTNGASGGANDDVQETNNNEDNCPIRNPRKKQFIDPNLYRMGEFLLNHTVEGRTISLQPRGLLNRSNYCYVNSILQALLACPPLYILLSELCKEYTMNENNKTTPVIDGMCRFVKEFKHLSAGQRVKRADKNAKKDQSLIIDSDISFEASWMYRMLNGTRSDSFLVEGRQEDAEEFLGFLLNGLNDEMLELMKLVKEDLNIQLVDKTKAQESGDGNEWQVMGPKNKGSITRAVDYVKTPISNIFGGSLKLRIHRTGDHATSNIQPFFTLPLNIKKVKTVTEALEALVTKNQLEGVTSVNTNEAVEAWQQVTLEELPVILILHLKCFDYQLNGCTKILKALEFPIDLKIDSKLLSSQPTTPKEKQYKLFAVVYHDGREATKGHYITDAFHVGYSSWIRYDDSSVKLVQEDQVLKPQGTRVPYLLFYRRSDKIRSK